MDICDCRWSPIITNWMLYDNWWVFKLILGFDDTRTYTWMDKLKGVPKKMSLLSSFEFLTLGGVPSSKNQSLTNEHCFLDTLYFTISRGFYNHSYYQDHFFSFVFDSNPLISWLVVLNWSHLSGRKCNLLLESL